MCRGKESLLATAVTTWRTRRTNDITPAKPWSRRNMLREMPRRSVRTLKEGPERSGTRLINERFAARRPASDIDDTSYLRQETITAK